MNILGWSNDRGKKSVVRENSRNSSKYIPFQVWYLQQLWFMIIAICEPFKLKEDTRPSNLNGNSQNNHLASDTAWIAERPCCINCVQVQHRSCEIAFRRRRNCPSAKRLSLQHVHSSSPANLRNWLLQELRSSLRAQQARELIAQPAAQNSLCSE